MLDVLLPSLGSLGCLWIGFSECLHVGVVFFPSLPFMGVMLFPSSLLGNVSREWGLVRPSPPTPHSSFFLFPSFSPLPPFFSLFLSPLSSPFSSFSSSAPAILFLYVSAAFSSSAPAIFFFLRGPPVLDLLKESLVMCV